MESHKAYYVSPIGLIEIAGNEEGITHLEFIDDNPDPSIKIHESLKEVIYQLDEYFTGIRKEFGLKLNPSGSEFQKRVWNQLNLIPFGKTCSYLDVSNQLGDENFTRAVGNANGKNPIAIVVPCHRVIGHNGKLTGYAGGLWRKEWLLNHEKGIIFGKQTELF
ncbi:MAG TPA: methylated-DNA--[protein]-cysteine S-methyltransferase [Bacteroidia bacterium]|jgi:methylated-DNA-[protein]-cysteine S-methyltransferase